ncbi:MAG: sodium/solute symporter [Bacteroidaceae bacterium]|nr:sodium/solute symporter [Bacteroidaceae bacterium]
MNNSGFETIDFVIFGFYIVLLVGMGLFLSRNKDGQEKNANDYFLAGNTLTWWAVGASLIAANISAEQFIGMSGSAYASGIAMAAYELMAAATLIVVAKFLLPLMIEQKIFTIPQFLRERYNSGVGLAFSILWLFLYVFVNLTSVAWLGALAIKQILGIPADPAVVMGLTVDLNLLNIIIALYIVAGVYSIYGGLASVAWTDVMQVTFLVGGGLITAYFALDAIAPAIGCEGAISALTRVMELLAQVPGDHHFNLVVSRNPEIANITDDPYFDIPGIVVIVGALWLTNLGYWGFNQYIIQKGLAAKSLKEAKKGLIFAAFLKILIPFIVCIPGVCAFLIWKGDSLTFMDGTVLDFSNLSLQGSIERSDDAYPFLIRNFTPTGIKGLSFAALTAAVISSLASMFNSTSTIFTMDVYKQYIDKKASDNKLVNVGRLTSVSALVIALIAVYPLMGGLDQAFQYIQEYSGFVYPGIVVIFGLGLLWKRASGVAAVAAAIGTFAFSIIFKALLPDTPFLIRMCYVFIVLAVMFIALSLASTKTVEAEAITIEVKNTQLKYGYMLLGVAVILLVALGAQMFGASSGQEWAITLERYGFSALWFPIAFFTTLAIYLRSNALDKVQDVKALHVNLDIFKTDLGFNLGAVGVIVILAVLYIMLW